LKIVVYTLFQDLGLGDFILVRLANLELYHVWKCNLVDPKQWVDISSILFSFLARNNVTFNNIILISPHHATKAKQNLDVTNDIVKV
jgi:hypothetical protein